MNQKMFLSITTILISIVSIFISLKMGRSQNRIALFDKKFETFNELNEYFKGEKSRSLRAEVNLMGGEIIYKDSNSLNKDVLFSKIRLLFSSNIWDKTQEVDKYYMDIISINNSIGEYFYILQEELENHDFLEEIKKYIDRDWRDWEITISDEDERKFKELCYNNQIYPKDSIDGDKCLNYYDLKEDENEKYKTVIELEKNLLLTIEDEVRVHKEYGRFKIVCEGSYFYNFTSNMLYETKKAVTKIISFF